MTLQSYLTESSKNRCAVLTYPADTAVGEIAASRGDAHERLLEKNWRRLMVDLTGLRNAPAPWDLWALAREVSATAPAGTRVALLIRPGQLRHVKLFENAAGAGGLAVRSFFTRERAVAWFESKP